MHQLEQAPRCNLSSLDKPVDAHDAEMLSTEWLNNVVSQLMAVHCTSWRPMHARDINNINKINNILILLL